MALGNSLDNQNNPLKIGKYSVINQVGRGSTSTVYLSYDPYYRRDVAIKLYNATGTDEEKSKSVRNMFLSEAHMIGKLQHPNILPIYDAGEEGQYCYVVSEHIHGARTLNVYGHSDHLLPFEDVVGIIYKCAKALHYAHGRGVIHRDIKPSNLMLTQDNDVRIIDFGIALISGSEVPNIDGVAGSPSYMSPEQIQSETVTSQSDLYSLGVVMYELLTGQKPFRGQSLSQLMHHIVFSAPPNILELRPEIPNLLASVVQKLLHKNPNYRFTNGAELAAELTRVHQQLRATSSVLDVQERFSKLRELKFFHDFSHNEIMEILRASDWQEYNSDEEVIRQGEMDNRFYVVVSGGALVIKDGVKIAALHEGDCFGEAGYVRGAKRQATIKAIAGLAVLKVSAVLLEQASAGCQLRFNKVFLQHLIARLHHPVRHND
jgi:hypothetical protein